MDSDTIAFIGVAIVIAVVPGPDMALVARNSLIGGRRIGFATVAGIIAGIFAWSLLAVAGVAGILATSAVAFATLKLAGALYLAYLGIATLRGGSGKNAGIRGNPPLLARAAARQGLLSAGLNPKLGVLFLTLLPQFTGPVASPARSLELAVLFAAIGVCWLSAYVYMIGAFSRVLSRPGPQRLVRYVTGTVLLALGARVAAERV